MVSIKKKNNLRITLLPELVHTLLKKGAEGGVEKTRSVAQRWINMNIAEAFVEYMEDLSMGTLG